MANIQRVVRRLHALTLRHAHPGDDVAEIAYFLRDSADMLDNYTSKYADDPETLQEQSVAYLEKIRKNIDTSISNVKRHSR